jgi:hypothetical protein
MQPIRSVADLHEAVNSGRVTPDHQLMLPVAWMGGPEGERVRALLDSRGIAFLVSTSPMAEALVTRAERRSV